MQHLYLQAGQPSFRELARVLDCSYTTANSAIRGTRLPTWKLQVEIGRHLGADEAKLHSLWIAARQAANEAGESDRIPLAERLESAHRSALDLLGMVRAMRVAPKFDLSKPIMLAEVPRAHKGKINAILFRPGSQTRATVGEDGMLRLWGGDDVRAPSLEIEAHDGAIYGAAFNRRGDLIATAASDRTVRLWSVKDGTPAAAPLEHDRSVRDVAFGPSGDLLVSVSSDGTTRMWDSLAGTVVDRPFQRRNRPLLCAAASMDGTLIAVGGADGAIDLWNSKTAEAPVRLQAHTDQIKTLAFHPQEPRLASSGMDRTVMLWDTDDGQKVDSYGAQHDGSIYSLGFSPDGVLLVSAGYDGHIRGLPTGTMTPATEIARVRASVRSIAFSPDGTTLAAATADGSILSCASARPTVSGAELEDVQAALEELTSLTRC
ncbi:WD40 repeat domain-containing protein [Krasilnikovia sp. M28-CT-15]|uniref:WD40 repeat domain-containing protein n=1 Tax=Krasilnikovia sp. M28-CT-15 TaxID=3373540 RepID=UPI00399D0BB7